MTAEDRVRQGAEALHTQDELTGGDVCDECVKLARIAQAPCEEEIARLESTLRELVEEVWREVEDVDRYLLRDALEKAERVLKGEGKP